MKGSLIEVRSGGLECPFKQQETHVAKTIDWYYYRNG